MWLWLNFCPNVLDTVRINTINKIIIEIHLIWSQLMEANSSIRTAVKALKENIKINITEGLNFRMRTPFERGKRKDASPITKYHPLSPKLNVSPRRWVRTYLYHGNPWCPYLCNPNSPYRYLILKIHSSYRHKQLGRSSSIGCRTTNLNIFWPFSIVAFHWVF